MDVYELAGRQHGVFTAAQAAEMGTTRKHLETLVRHGCAERVLPGVYRMRAAPETWRQRVAAAVLSVPGGLASHRTAAVLHELDGFTPGRIEVVAERWTRRHRRTTFMLHETKDLVAGDIDEVDGIACTSLVRTLVDLPAVAHEFRAGQALDHAAKRDTTMLARVTRRHLEVARRGRNGTVALRTLLEERSDGRKVDSGFERRALRLIGSSDLPQPMTQWPVRDGAFVAYLDLAWPEHLLAMECDSIEHHLNVAAFTWDRERRRTLQRLGWRVLEFSYDDVTERGPMVLRELRRHLQPIVLA